MRAALLRLASTAWADHGGPLRTEGLSPLTVGLLAAYSMRSLLFGVAPHDPMSFVLVAMVLFGLATVATLIPAVQAIRSSPVTSLREG